MALAITVGLTTGEDSITEVAATVPSALLSAGHQVDSVVGAFAAEAGSMVAEVFTVGVDTDS